MTSEGIDADWYVSRDGEQAGPMPRADLQRLYAQGKLAPDDYVWSAELGDWKLASEVLQRPPARMPPPTPTRRTTTRDESIRGPSRSAAAPNAGEFVKPKYDYELFETDDTLTFAIKTRSRLRLGLAMLVAIPLLIFAVLAILLGLIFHSGGGLGWVVGGIVAAGFTYFALKWGNRKIPRPPVVFDQSSISVGGRVFALSHVSHIGHAGGSQPTFVFTRAQATGAAIGAAIAESAGYYVYIVYGSERIPVVSGLDAQSVTVVYDTICGFLRRFGHNFS
jgi:hypothetical protein